MSDQNYNPPPGPPPGRGRGQPSSRTASMGSNAADSSNYGFGSNNPWRDAQTKPAKRQRAPSISNSPEYEPPPSFSSSRPGQDVEMKDESYQPPSGPPPKKPSIPFDTKPGQPSISYDSKPGQPSALYDMKSGPPPSKGDNSQPAPPPYDPWYGGPEEQLLPPPSFAAAHPSNTKSPTANADFDDAAKGHEWCRQNQLWRPSVHDPRILEKIRTGDLRLTMPPNTTGISVYQPSRGHTYLRTSPSVRDTIFLSNLPVYATMAHSPLATGRTTKIYFEVHVLGLGDRYNEQNEVESGIAIGFVAPPYPAWRLPGWHRGSLGVHGDDGRRYVDNSFGGMEFTSAFKKGDVVGIGMTFSPPMHGQAATSNCHVFFTRNGQHDGGWNLHEVRDRDVEEGDVVGLEGDHDLLAAVGVFGGTEFEVVFQREDWKFQP